MKAILSWLHCAEIYWVLQIERTSPQILTHRDLLDQYSYADLNLDHMGPENLDVILQYLFDG